MHADMAFAVDVGGIFVGAHKDSLEGLEKLA